jgi:hypothetical protein
MPRALLSASLRLSCQIDKSRGSEGFVVKNPNLENIASMVIGEALRGMAGELVTATLQRKGKGRAQWG